MANRMRVIASGVTLARRYGHRLRIIWYKDFGLNCRFDQLFEPIQASDITLKEAGWLDKILLDRPRKKNFYIPRLFHKMLFNDGLYEDDDKAIFVDQAFDYATWLRVNRSVYIATCYPFQDIPHGLYRELFVPVPPLAERVEGYASRFSSHPVGVHIRRTDNAVAIAKSPLSLFIEAMETEVAAHPDTIFFVASDSEEVKNTLEERFKGRILTASNPADRNSLQGMEDAVVDFFTLGKTTKILGSCNSSFSQLAAQLYGIPYQEISK